MTQVPNPENLEPHAHEALMALALQMEEEAQLEEERTGPVVRDNIPDLDKPFLSVPKTRPQRS